MGRSLHCRHRRARSGTRHAHRIAVPLNSTQISPYVAVNKDAFPNSPAYCRRPHQIIPPAKTSTGFSREFSSAISGFRSLCGRKQRSSLKPSRSNGPAFWNLSLGAGSRFENSGLHPYASTGPATLDRCCERNVVAPGEYSKWFFCVPIGLYRGNFRPATARGMPARSALGGRSGINPAAVINPSISAALALPGFHDERCRRAPAAARPAESSAR